MNSGSNARRQQAERLTQLYGARQDAALRETAKGTITAKVASADGLNALVSAHLAGDSRAGVLLLKHGRVACGGLDLDAHGPNKVDDPVALAALASKQLAALGVQSYMEHTKRAPGTRVMVFTEPVEASAMQRVLRHIAKTVGLPNGVEVFPKQVHEGSGVGNGLWLPYFAPDAARGRTVIATSAGSALSLDDFLVDAEKTRNAADALRELADKLGVVTPPAKAAPTGGGGGWMHTPVAQALLALPGAAPAKKGVAICCPMHDDATASAIVFPEGNLFCSACQQTWTAKEWAKEATVLVGDIARDLLRRDRRALEVPVTVRLSDVTTKPVDWLWAGRVPLGKLVLLDGDPGLGKSTLALDIAARVTRGQPMPDAENAHLPPSNVLVLSAEDAPDDTIRPRLEAAGGDAARVECFKSVQTADGHERLLSLPDDAHHVEARATTLDAKLIIIDPLSAFVSERVNMHRDADVRRCLAPLSRLAEKLGATILVVRHLTKAVDLPALYRGGGSIGIIGAARACLVLAKAPDNDHHCILASVKNNLAPPAPALVFEKATVNGVPRIHCVGEATQTADELLTPNATSDSSALRDAMGFLKELLKTGPLPASEVFTAAQAEGVRSRTLRRAKEQLGVTSVRDEAEARWLWTLPETA